MEGNNNQTEIIAISKSEEDPHSSQSELEMVKLHGFYVVNSPPSNYSELSCPDPDQLTNAGDTKTPPKLKQSAGNNLENRCQKTNVMVDEDEAIEQIEQDLRETHERLKKVKYSSDDIEEQSLCNDNYLAQKSPATQTKAGEKDPTSDSTLKNDATLEAPSLVSKSKNHPLAELEMEKYTQKSDKLRDGDQTIGTGNQTPQETEKEVGDIEDKVQQQQTDQQNQEQRDSESSPSPSNVSTKTNNDNDDNNKEQDLVSNNSTLGRNRRVRQKNRYFADFHCMQLVKGCRSKDDYDAYSPSTSATRSSNRRSTTDSSRGLHGNNINNSTDKDVGTDQTGDPTGLFISKYCRKCFIKTAHDDNNECQACLYKKIVSSSKRQKTINSRSRASTRQQANNNTPTNTSIITSSTTSLASKQASSIINIEQPLKEEVIVKNNDNIINNSNGDKKRASDNKPVPMGKSNCNASSANDANIDSSIDSQNRLELTKLDTWTPDQVAQYVSSRGFTDESELFRLEAVDGISLLLMKRTDFTYGLKMKLGPALKLYDQVCRLRKDYLQETATAS